jgi:threonine aldolase
MREADAGAHATSPEGRAHVPAQEHRTEGRKEDRRPVIDLRSDTVTQPTHAMRAAMAQAPVGDDCYGEDPTVEVLQATVARLLGKERALLFPSGIMANQAALLAQGSPGDEILVGSRAHLVHYEEGSVAAHGGMFFRMVEADQGRLTEEAVRASLRLPSRFQPRTRMLALENTHLDSGGTVLSAEQTAAMAEVARSAGLAVHLDGARLWNAAAALGTPERNLVESVDTVMVCLSKGLGAPVGSMLAGPADTMERAWRIRRRLGGQMRQAGILAAAGLHAIEHHRGRLRDDHRRAHDLAVGLRALPRLHVDVPETNVVMISVEGPEGSGASLLSALAGHGVLLVPFGTNRLRAVLHLGIDDADVQHALEVFGSVLDRPA